MILRKLLFIFLMSTIGVGSYAQTNKALNPDVLQENIKKVENSLSPLVLNNGKSLWNLEKQMQKYKISGLSIAVINNYEIEWAKGYGLSGNNEISNVTEQTVFQAASMSKFVNAVAIMKLAELKKIDLDDDINNYLTTWKFPYDKSVSSNQITIRQLLSHTAGLSSHGFDGYKNSNKLPSIIQTLEGKKPANSEKVIQVQQSNKEFKYSGGGTVISQFILENNTDSSYENFVDENIFTLLAMNDSFYSTEFNKYPKDLAFGHKGNGKTLKNNFNLYPESAAAGLWTTPSDLAKLIIDIQLSLKNNTSQILSSISTQELIKPTLLNSNSALGLFTQKEDVDLYLQHSGANKGFRGKFIFSADKGNGVIIMLNGTNTEIIEEIIRSVASVYNWAGFEKLIASPELNVDDADLNKFLGVYTLGNRKVDVSLKKGKLILTEKGKWSSKLTALNNSTFVVDIVKPQATIEFVKDENGSISKCILKQGELTEWIKKK